MSQILTQWPPAPRPNPHRAKDIVIAQPGDVGREARVWNEFRSLKLRPIGGSSLQSWEEALVTGKADGAALASSTTETSILPTPAVYTLPANFWYPGRTLRIWLAGRVGTTGTPTLRIRIYYGGLTGVALLDTTALTSGSGMTNNTWWLRAHVTCRSEGSGTAGTSIGIGELIGVTGAATQVQIPATAPAVSSGFDTTLAKAVDVSALWGTSSASNTIQLHQYLLEAVN